MNTPLVELRALGKRFGTRRALDGIDLVVDTPTLLGVVGPDGAGKTTLLRMLVGLLEVSSGSGRVLGHDLRGDVTTLKTATGYVSQVFSLNRDLSVGENLRFTGRLHGLPAATFTARRDALLTTTGLAPFIDRPAGALSGGMKQKLAIANALLPSPRLVVLDEPTAGVDVVARGDIWTLLETARADGTLVVVSTSYLDEAAACERLVYLDQGRVIADGPPDALCAQAAVAVYRVWADDPGQTAAAARRDTDVRGARAAGRWARIEVAHDARDVPARLASLPGGVRFVEATVPDLEAAFTGFGNVA